MKVKLGLLSEDELDALQQARKKKKTAWWFPFYYFKIILNRYESSFEFVAKQWNTKKSRPLNSRIPNAQQGRPKEHFPDYSSKCWEVKEDPAGKTQATYGA
jgi:hypothetical protein